MKGYVYRGAKMNNDTVCTIKIQRGTKEYEPRVLFVDANKNTVVSIYMADMDKLVQAWQRERKQTKEPK